MSRLRYLRAAISALYAYVEGVVNEWCTELNADRRLGPAAIQEFCKRNKFKKQTTIQDFVRYMCLALKCEFVTECVNKRGHPLSNFDGWEFKKAVRDGYAHPKPGDDYALFDTLSSASFKAIEEGPVKWLDTAARILELPRHPDTRAVMASFETHMAASGEQVISGSSSDPFLRDSSSKPS
jgi:hypothetical protein